MTIDITQADLRAENERLRAALNRIKREDSATEFHAGRDGCRVRKVSGPYAKIARAALASKGKPACESCGGLNTSCPEGCERDPLTGELASKGGEG